MTYLPNFLLKCSNLEKELLKKFKIEIFALTLLVFNIQGAALQLHALNYIAM